jgi:glutamate N-acetyltransferase/amino-acid N-acetyltransferase
MSKKARGAILYPKGFRGAATHAGIKRKSGAPDVALIVSDLPAAFAAVFTTNRVAAAPVKYSKAIAQKGSARAAVVNAGNANACTGKRGDRDAKAMAKLVAAGIHAKSNEVAVSSTGIIGEALPMRKIERGIRTNMANLSSSREAARKIARAIMTTDTFPKEALAELRLSGRKVRIGGIAKGAGMICPDMATLLSFITTDAALSPRLLKRALKSAVEVSFNRLTIDGHTSTNDSVMLFANGASGARSIARSGKDFSKFTSALTGVCVELARMIARDGEGATKLIEIHVTGAPSEKVARSVAFAIATSPLVKTAMHGEDPNWGRIVSAAGYASTKVVEERLTLMVNGVKLFSKGVPARPQAKTRCARALRKKDIDITLDLGAGGASSRVWTCDLTRDYVAINAYYHT